MSTTKVPSPTSRLRLGHARVDITPPVGIYHRLWGAARHDRATGVHRPLFADVLALAPLSEEGDAGRPQLVRAFLDLAGLVQSQHRDAVAALAAGAGTRPEQVVLTYSHTHSSGWFVPDRIPLPGGELILPYLAGLYDRLREAGQQASAALRETTITYATGHSAMGASRDYHDQDGGIYACGYNPDEPADDTVTLARFTDAARHLTGTLVHYACHPTTLAWENSLISPDYPGALRKTVERVTGAPCVFAQGACGDIGPRRGFTGDVSVADRNGEQVAYAALEALTSMGLPQTDFSYGGPVVSGATLGTWRDAPHSDASRLKETQVFEGGAFTVDLPIKPRPDRQALSDEMVGLEVAEREARARGDTVAARDAGARIERARRWLARLDDLPTGETFPLQCTSYRLGDAVWVASGGEPYSAIQTELRKRFPSTTIVFSPLMGDLQVAYLLTREKYGTGLYQEEPSILAPGCLELLTEALVDQITRQGAVTSMSGRSAPASRDSELSPPDAQRY